MMHWAGTLQSRPIRRRPNGTRTRQQHSSNHPPRSYSFNNRTLPRLGTRFRFPADLFTRRNVGQGESGVKDVDADGRTVLRLAGMAVLLFCCTISAAVALGVLCRKRNTVFPLRDTKNDDPEDVEDDLDDVDLAEGDSALTEDYCRADDSSLHCRRRHSTEGSINTPKVAQSSCYSDDDSFRFPSTESPLPATSAHARDDVSWCGAEATGDSERQLSHQDCSTPDQTHCDVDNAAAVAPDAVTSSSSSSSSKLRSFVALVTSVHRPQLARSLGHVISDVIRSSWLMTHRQRAPAAAGDQSAAGDVTCDDVDMTSLLPTL